MAYAMTKQGSLDNCVTYEFICDAITDMNAIENRYRTIGSVAVVLQGESDGLEVYIAGSDKQWNNLGSMGAASNSQGGSSGLSIYICAQNEVSNGLPDISEPDESTIYLVPAGNTSGNLYEEYIYANNAWEKFGSGGNSIDLSNYVQKTDIATQSTAGLVKVLDNGNVTFNEQNQLVLTLAGTAVVKSGQSDHPISVTHQHEAAFYGLAKAAGQDMKNSNNAVGTYTDDAKSAIRTMIGAGTYTKPNDGIPAADLANTYLIGAQTLELGNLLTNTGNGVTNATLSQDYTTNFESLKDKQITLFINEDEYPITLTKSTDERPYGPYTIYVTIFSSNETNSENHPIFTYEHSAYDGYDSTTDICTICLDTEYNNPAVKLQYKGDIRFNYPQMYINCNDDGTGGTKVATLSDISGKANSTDLNNYVAKTDYATAQIAGIIKTNADYGLGQLNATNYTGTVSIKKASLSDIKTGTNQYKPIVPDSQHSAVFYGLAKAAGDSTQNASDNAVGIYTADAQAAIKSMLGLPIPAAPVADGNYILKVNVASGTPTYSWVALSDLSGVTF